MIGLTLKVATLSSLFINSAGFLVNTPHVTGPRHNVISSSLNTVNHDHYEGDFLHFNQIQDKVNQDLLLFNNNVKKFLKKEQALRDSLGTSFSLIKTMFLTDHNELDKGQRLQDLKEIITTAQDKLIPNLLATLSHCRIQTLRELRAKVAPEFNPTALYLASYYATQKLDLRFGATLAALLLDKSLAERLAVYEQKQHIKHKDFNYIMYISSANFLNSSWYKSLRPAPLPEEANVPAEAIKLPIELVQPASKALTLLERKKNIDVLLAEIDASELKHTEEWDLTQALVLYDLVLNSDHLFKETWMVYFEYFVSIKDLPDSEDYIHNVHQAIMSQHKKMKPKSLLDGYLLNEEDGAYYNYIGHFMRDILSFSINQLL